MKNAFPLRKVFLLHNGLFWITGQLMFIDPYYNNEMCVKKPNQSTKCMERCYFFACFSTGTRTRNFMLPPLKHPSDLLYSIT